MSLMQITSESLTRQLAREIPDVYVVIAKHSVLGMDDEAIREVIGCTAEELSEILNDSTYREVRLLVGAAQSQQLVDQATGWDALEALALGNLIKRAPLERDTDTLLRIASVANKAARRAAAGKAEGVLDPAAHGRTARINLTTRLVKQFTKDGVETQTIEKQLSISDGSMANPGFDEIDSFLHVSNTPTLPRNIEVKTSTPEVTLEELDQDSQRKGF
jgi:hypothetical protein